MIASGKDKLQSTLEATDILIVSQGEAETLTGRSDPNEACRTLTLLGPKAILLTLGNRGVLVAERNNPILIPAIPVEHVVDTTGAGDAFSAGVIVGLMEGSSL